MKTAHVTRYKGAVLALMMAATLGSAALAGPAVTPLVSTNWLSDNLAAEGLVILDLRSPESFQTSHIPGAVNTDPAQWSTTRGDVPWLLPEVGELEDRLSSVGIGNQTSVVIVPTRTGISALSTATWIYCVFKYLGHDAVAILDGGWSDWLGEGLPIGEWCGRSEGG